MIDCSVKLEILNQTNKNTLSEAFEIEYTELAENYIKAKMPVNKNNCQQLGMLSGGATAALAETVAGMGSYLSIDRELYYTVGLELKINHIKTVLNGFVYTTAVPLHIGKTTQVWEIKNIDETGELVSVAIHTLAVIPHTQQSKIMLGNFIKLLKNQELR